VKESRLFFHWKSNTVCRRYRTGASIHSHTLHSRESLDFLNGICAKIPVLCHKIDEYKAGYFERHGRQVDLKRAWWTPPLSPKQAWMTEKNQIENVLGLEALVSLSDHDNIDAGTMLSVSEPAAGIPISVEWTVPFRETFFHIGVHNLPAFEAPAWMERMKAYTAAPDEARLAEMFDGLHADPSTLIVFNHPMWDEKSIGFGIHQTLVHVFWKQYGQFLHAMELNGLRPWQENDSVVSLAKACEVPLISGGDRHAREPNACVNLTNAATFSEFVDEIRHDRWSDILFMPHYRENFKVRIIQNMCEVLREDRSHSLGWEKWSDRIFYLCDDGQERSLNTLFADKVPAVIDHFISLMSLVEAGWLRSALRFALPRKEEPAL
jgi:hypothetical protein